MLQSIQLDSQLSELVNLQEWLKRNLPKDISLKLHNNILLINQELVTNSIVHANSLDKSKQVYVTLKESTDLIEFTIVDEGSVKIVLPTKDEAKNMDYLAENGRGLKLAVLLSDTIYTEKSKIVFIFKKDKE